MCRLGNRGCRRDTNVGILGRKSIDTRLRLVTVGKSVTYLLAVEAAVVPAQLVDFFGRKLGLRHVPLLLALLILGGQGVVVVNLLELIVQGLLLVALVLLLAGMLV